MAIYHFVRYIWRNRMPKTTAGIVLVAGIFVSFIAAMIGRSATNASLDPSLDTYYALVEYGSMAGIVAGLGLFFWGAVVFARK